ncbi:MAG: hypothetical protein XE06_1379 [Anaerolineaceae bacterium 46_22]|jgi:hypothetical protein|nr:MAG: hypothetical protein XE06_1379 [Anaerolineaceae bacterium 46_22]
MKFHKWSSLFLKGVLQSSILSLPGYSSSTIIHNSKMKSFLLSRLKFFKIQFLNG